MNLTNDPCVDCGARPNDPGEPWSRPCPSSPDRLHWSLAQLRDVSREREAAFARQLREANRLLLAAARIDAAHRTRGWRQRRRAIRALPSHPDGLDYETEAAKISDTIAVHLDDQSVPVGPTFDAIEGRR